MANIAVFLYPHRIGVARVNKPGKKPSFSSVQWQHVEDAAQLLAEPMLLVAAIKEMVGEEKGCDIYLNVWPGACKEIMFSYDKKRSKDLKRLRRSELETVFHGEIKDLYTYDLLLDKGKASAAGRSRRIIYTMPKATVNLMLEAFSAQKMKLKRIAPMDATAAESALQYWAPNKSGISVCLTLDEACTSIAFLHGGVLCALRTIPDGFAGVLDTYMEVTGNDLDTCIHMLRDNGVVVPCDKFDMVTIQDDVMRTLNRVSVEVVKTLHNTFGDEAVLDQVLLCGNFARTVGLADYLNTMLHTTCVIAGTDSLEDAAVRAIVLEDNDLEPLFHMAATTDTGADMLWEKRQTRSERISNVTVCGIITVVMAGIMAITPISMRDLNAQLEKAQNIMQQPEYVAVQELLDQKTDLAKQKESLVNAIEALPHGATNTAGIVKDLFASTKAYGNVGSIRVNYDSETIELSLTVQDYNSFILWQNMITSEGRFSFKTPPTFSGSGMLYSVNAVMTATDFTTVEEEG